jgi:hypothetical protein
VVDSIILVHGLEGHPERTWTYSAKRNNQDDSPAHIRPSQSRLGRFFGSSPRNLTPSPHRSHQREWDQGSLQDTSVFWPGQFLPEDFPTARIMTYGYDSHISHFFKGPATQSHILAQGRDLLNRLERCRRDAEFRPIQRPIIFIAHSLGGIIVKEALRQSKGAVGYQENQADIYQSTRAIIFLGTPHRGASIAEWGEIVRRIVTSLGFNTNDQLLRGLQPDSEPLEDLRIEFGKMLNEKKWRVYSFQETKGISSAPGLENKVSLADQPSLFIIETRC